MEYIGCSRQYISIHCSNGSMPHIPGKPTRFFEEDIIIWMRSKLEGGQYGKRKSRKKLKPKGETH